MQWLFFIFGLASFIGQILLLREILVIFHGTEISIGIFYGGWLLEIGLGAALAASLSRRMGRRVETVFLWSLVALGFSLLLQVLFIRMVPLLFGAAPAELAPLRGILAAAPAGTLVTAFLTGFLFPLGCRTASLSDDRVIARLYVFEAMGSLAAGLLLTFLLLRFLEPLRIAASAAGVTGVALLVYGLRRRLGAALIGGPALVVMALLLFLPLGRRIMDWSILMRWTATHPGMELLLSKATPYEEVELARLGSQISFFGNGKIVSSFPDPHTADRLTALIMAENPKARRFLLIGGGIGSLLSSLLKYPVSRVDVVEPDPWAFRIVRDYLPKEERASLSDPRVNFIFRDGRFYVNRMDRPTYDVILAQVPDPVSAFWNRYYTLEFFKRVAGALRPDGMFVTRVTSAENFWGSEVASYAGSVYHTLRKVFPMVRGTPGDETIFLASTDPDLITLDPAELMARYETLPQGHFDPAAFLTLLPPRRTRFVAEQLERSPVLLNTDARPVSSSLAMILWGRFSGERSLGILETLRRGGLLVYLIPIALFIGMRLGYRIRWPQPEAREGRLEAVLAMAAVGAAAMGLQIVLLYSYQSLFGYVFERIGLFAAIFMTGLVAGGAVAGRALHRISSKPASTAVLLLGLAGMCIALPEVLKLLAGREPATVEAVLLSLAFLSGILTGAVFPLVASRRLELSGDSGEASGSADAADHFGAAAGAAVTGTLLVPLLGVNKACLVLGLVASAPAVLLLADFAFRRLDSVLTPFRAGTRISFPYLRTTWALCFLVAAAFAWRVFLGPPGIQPTVKFSRNVLENVSGSTEFKYHDNPFPWYEGTRVGDKGRTFSLSTIPTAGDIRGYGGPINLLLSVDEKGKILGVKVVQSKETPSYLRGMDDWLRRLRGRSVLDSLDRKVDAVSGATITSRAILKIIGKTGRKIRGPLLGMPGRSTESKPSHWLERAAASPRVWLVVILVAFFLVAFHMRSRKLRSMCLLLSLVVLGIYLNAPFTSLDALSLLVGRIPAAHVPWRLLLLVSIGIISILWGQAFCGWLCPFGALQELINFRALRRRPSAGLEQPARYLKFLILAVVLCLFLVTDDVVWVSFSPLQSFFSLEMSGGVLALSITVLAASVFYFRFWCRYLCPAGAFLALFNRVRLLRRSVPPALPARCDLGVGFPDDVDCIQCHRCHFQAGPRAGREK